MNKYVPIIAGATLLLAALGGGWYLIRRNADPVERAEQFERDGNLRAAQLEWRNAVAKFPKSPEIRLRLAASLFQFYDTVSAEKEYKIARALGADRYTVIGALGDIYLAQNRWQAILTEVPRTAPAPAIVARDLMLRSIAQLATNQLSDARETLAAAQRAAPDSIETTLIAARVALAVNDTAAAETRVDQVLQRDPRQTDALMMKLHLLSARNERAAARAIADRAVESAPWSPPVLLDRANQLLISGQDARAQADVDNVLARLPRYPGALYLNALLLARAGRYSDASVALDQLRPVIDQYPRALFVQALVAANLGNVESAVELARRYNARMPADPDGVRLLARTQLAARRPDRVAPLLEKAIASGQTDPETLDLLGAAYAAMGNGPAALRIRQKAAAQAPGNADILTHLGLSQLRQGNATAAAATLKRSVQLAPAQPGAVEALVAAALAAGDYDKATAAVDAFRTLGGGTETVDLMAADILLARNDVDAARLALIDIVKRFPDSVTAKVNLAKVLVIQGRRKDGEMLLRETLAKDPANMTPLTAQLQFLLQANQLPQAIRVMEQAQTAAPNNPLLTAMLSDLMVRAQDPARAIALLRARRDAGDFPAVLQGALARAQTAAGLLDDATATYRDELKAAPSDLDARHAQVALLLQRGRFDDARASLQEGLAASPGTAGIMSALVALEARTNGPAAALKLATDLRQDPANLPASTLLQGDAQMLAKNWKEAAASYQTEFDRTPSAALALRIAEADEASNQADSAVAPLRRWQQDHPDDADIAQTLARLDLKAARWDSAQKNLEVVLARRPSDTIALNNLAWIYQSKNDPRARPLAQRAYMQGPTPNTADTLGWIMVQQNEAQAAIPLLQQGARQQPPNPTATYHLAVALANTGSPYDAVALLEPLTASPVAFDDRPAALKLLDDLRSRR